VHAIKELLGWLESTQLAMFVSQSSWGFAALEMIHVTATTFVFGMITIVDLRLIGVASKGSAVTDLYRDVIPLTWIAFVVAAITGSLLFIGQAMEYSENIAVRMKFALLVLIAINMLAFRLIIYPGVSKWDRDAAVPLAARLAGAISLAGWIMVVASARWIAYLMI
jgi:hypothetical protein